jgi:hypothetical protein
MRSLTSIFLLFFWLPILALAQAAPACPHDPLRWATKSNALEALHALGPKVVNEMSPDNCDPKLSGSLAFGLPLCLLDEVIPVQAAAPVVTLEGSLVSFSYLIEYTPERSAKLQEILTSRYQPVSPSLYPKERRFPPYVKVSALFQTHDAYVVLVDPPDDPYHRVPGRLMSGIEYTKKPYFAIMGRDLNTCK